MRGSFFQGELRSNSECEAEAVDSKPARHVKAGRGINNVEGMWKGKAVPRTGRELSTLCQCSAVDDDGRTAGVTRLRSAAMDGGVGA